ncbi:hypothetical protein H0H92_009527 [Tricholoma furcatifolium]|nr:hypothetical protein H0H92_009527 [Tricholoma furcatifolium]
MIRVRRDRVTFASISIAIILITILSWKTDSPEAPHRNAAIVTKRPSLVSPQEVLADDFDAEGPSHKDASAKDLRPAIGPLTIIPKGAHSPGFTILDNLYLRNGTFYVITPDPSKFPPREDMISVPRGLAERIDLTPTDKEMQFISPDDAEGTLGKYAIRTEGLSVMVYDPTEFMSHFYHWWGEIILGAWRILAFEGEKTQNVLTPRRFLMPFSIKGKFRDDPGVDGPLMRAAWPSTPIEESDYWEDLIALDATVVFERVMLINRAAAHRHPWSGQWAKMIAGTMAVPAPENFWEPIRTSLITNLLGYLPTPAGDPKTPHRAEKPSLKPLVTYVSRQGAGARRLRQSDHEALIMAFADLEAEGVCEFREARMERMTVKEQVELAARSTVLIGVHGNGLTHQLWMAPSHRSAVFEIFDPEGFLFDYEMLARNVGHRVRILRPRCLHGFGLTIT